jgi:hypothetical protein
MRYVFPIEPGNVLNFAHSVGDLDPVFQSQLHAQPGTSLMTPPTFMRGAERYDPSRVLPFDQDPAAAGLGGSGDTVHAEQHYEYFGALKAGDRITVETRPGRTWTKHSRSRLLQFGETITEYRGSDGELVVLERKVSVQVIGG